MTAAAPGAPAIADRPLLGVLLMVAFCLMAPLGDATAKLLGALPLAQIMLGRYGMQAALLLPLIRGRRLDARVWRLTVVRTLLHVASFTTFVAALRFLPMADAVAIMFVLPFILLLLGRFFLGEEVGPHRLAACAVGFLGTLGTGAHLLMTWSLRFAPSATLAPIQYLEIPFATLIGYLVFGDLPNGVAALGIAVTIAAGFYVLHRERRAARR